MYAALKSFARIINLVELFKIVLLIFSGYGKSRWYILLLMKKTSSRALTEKKVEDLVPCYLSRSKLCMYM